MRQPTQYGRNIIEVLYDIDGATLKNRNSLEQPDKILKNRENRGGRDQHDEWEGAAEAKGQAKTSLAHLAMAQPPAEAEK